MDARHEKSSGTTKIFFHLYLKLSSQFRQKRKNPWSVPTIFSCLASNIIDGRNGLMYPWDWPRFSSITTYFAHIPTQCKYICLLLSSYIYISCFILLDPPGLSRLTTYWSTLDFWKIEFEKSSWMDLFFCLLRTWMLQATQAVKVKFELDK